VAKIYVVKVAGQPDESKLDKLRRGVSIAEKGGRRVRTGPAKIRLIREGDNPWLEVTIIEGRNRQVRKMFEEVGHHVEKIRRVQYGPLALDVPPGDWRNLTLLEVAKLKTAASGIKSSKLEDIAEFPIPKPQTPSKQFRPARPHKSPHQKSSTVQQKSSTASARSKPARPAHSHSAAPRGTRTMAANRSRRSNLKRG
jgi:23S rRNA pseudouridine2605 synthase